ncbi:DUF6263 family protein [Cellulophaga omnivescoria]|uniref:DUF6263 family protein n=1 Tax=Cellulophaga omnivescoria TaxID=1888890 RepID=UPI0022F02020|nr:DUF6263 family protein [Cellulophaga omnivescoria]WBU89576.1 DUF6263 family protein [Cellulophaga omnivescoria]
MKKLFFLASVLLCLTSVNAQTKLEYKLSVGDIFIVQQNAKQVITQEMQGMSHELTNDITGEYKMKVIEKKDGAYSIEMSFTDLNMKMTSNLQGVLMDIKAKEVKEGDMQSKMFNSILNIPVKITLAANGNITNVDGGENLINKMMDASGITDETTLATIKTSLAKEYGTEGLANSFKQMTYIYPNVANKVAVGDTWENEYTGKLNTKNKWTLEAQDANTTTLSCTADVVMTVKDANANMDLTGTQTTKAVANTKTGFITSMEVTGSSTGNSTVPMLGDQKIPTKITSTIIYKTIE